MELKDNITNIFDTSKQRKEASKLLSLQLETLEHLINSSKLTVDQLSSMKTIISELTERYKFLNSSKRWLFNFEGGGWNSTYAVDMEEAVNNAIAKYENSVCKVNKKSFRISTDEDEKNLLSMFN